MHTSGEAGLRAALMHLYICHAATPGLHLSLQQVRDICKNGNQTARMDVAVLGARLQEKPPVKMGWTGWDGWVGKCVRKDTVTV